MVDDEARRETFEALFLDEGERLVGRVLVLVDELAERVELLPERGQTRPRSSPLSGSAAAVAKAVVRGMLAFAAVTSGEPGMATTCL